MTKRNGGRFVDTYLPYLLAQAAHRMSYRFHKELKRLGVRESEWRVLSSLIGSDGMALSTLENYVLAPQSTLSRTADRLVGRGLIERHEDQDDRRAVKIRLTAEGADVAKSLIKAAETFQTEDLTHLSETEVRRLRAALASLFPAPD